VGCDDKTVRLCDPATGAEVRRLVGHEDAVTSLVFTRDRKTLISGSKDGSVCLWDRKSGTPTQRLMVPGQVIHCLALSPDGTLLAAGSSEPPPRFRGQVNRWELPSCKERRPFPYNPGVQALAFSPNGRTLAAGGISGPLAFYDPDGLGDRGTQIDLGFALVTNLAFTPDGKTVVCGCRNGVIYLFDSASRKFLRQLAGLAVGCKTPGVHAGITALSFSRDGKTLAAGGSDNIIHVWEMASGKQRFLDQQPARPKRSFIPLP
jgi:WD40 repeat protein